MRNHETEAAWHYHNGTKHPNGMLLNRFHVYHPSHRPNPYKVYKDVQQIGLPLDKGSLQVSTLDAISTRLDFGRTVIPDLGTLSRILYFSAGITKKIRFPPPLGEVGFRAASCTGALYHIEVYVICTDIGGLGAGVYHFDPEHMRLDTIRPGDFRGFLAGPTAGEPSIRDAPVVLAFTDVFSRNSIKYQSREYRHAFWDCGTILANTLAISSAHKIPSRIVTGFVDSQISKLLGIDIEKEAPIALVPLGRTDKEAPTCPAFSGAAPEAIESDYDIEYPEINAMHDASSLLTESDVLSWRQPIEIERAHHGNGIMLAENIKSAEPVEMTIIKRGSTRRFSLESVTFGQLSTILGQATYAASTDYANNGQHLSDMYIIANSVEDLESGSYHYTRNSLELLRQGNFRHVSANLGLDQDLPHDASATIFFMSDLDKILGHFGNRGYRIAQIDAATTGGRMYLAAYSLGLGATGLTFYDDLVTDFFSPHAKDKEAMFLMAIGKKEVTLNHTLP